MRAHKAGYVVPVEQPKLDRVLVPGWLATDGPEQGRGTIRYEQKSPLAGSPGIRQEPETKSWNKLKTHKKSAALGLR